MTPADETTAPAAAAAPERGLSRRALLLGTGFAVGGAAAAAAVIAGQEQTDPGAASDPAAVARIAAAGRDQAGVARPSVPQTHCLFAVADLDTGDLQSSLSALGGAILDLTSPDRYLPTVTPDGPGDLTVTVGLGADALAATAHPELAAAVALPAFSGDAALDAVHLGGDLMITVNAGDASVLEPVLAHLSAVVRGFRLRWSDFGVRGAPDAGVSRNPFGYFDGIIVPRTEDELAANVWIADGPLAGGTIGVVRRFQLDTAGFRALSQHRRDAVMGRSQASGAPLSGGKRQDQIDLQAKADDGTLLVPARAHARAAHPSFTGSALMLRRSYNYRASAVDHGHLFISYQRNADTFAKTQLRLDEVDDLMAFSTPTATACFAILPGFEVGRALGASLF